jgi:hypothetical protein
LRPVKIQLYGVRAAEAEITGDKAVKESQGLPGLGERDGAG